MIAIYSIGYMHDDPGSRVTSPIFALLRFHAYAGHGGPFSAALCRLGISRSVLLFVDQLLV